MEGTTDIVQRPLHRTLYLASLVLIVVSLPLSRFLLTVGELLLVVNWLAEGNLRVRCSRLRSDRAALFLMLIYVLNIIALLWSHDRHYGLMNDLLHKLPTLFLPLVVATTPPPDRREVRQLIILFIGSVLAATLAGLSLRIANANLFYREASPFIPGIYLGMMLIIAASLLLGGVVHPAARGWRRWSAIILSAWFIFFIFYLRALSAIASLAVVVLLLVIRLAVRSRSITLKIALPTVTAAILLTLALMVTGLWSEVNTVNEVRFGSLPQQTLRGNEYYHDTLSILTENGNYVYLCIAEGELREAWNERSSLDYDGEDLMGQELKGILIRYLASKGLKKEREGVAMLDDDDIRAIERGIANWRNVRRPGIVVRLHEELTGLSYWHRSSGRETSWGSLSKRLDLWRAAVHAFKRYPLTGWGTGGVMRAMEYGKEGTGSSLSDLKMNPHSQYLYLLLSQGVAGMIITILLYVAFVRRKELHRSLLFTLFIVTFLVNFVGNNSFESQPGQELFIVVTVAMAYFRSSASEE